MLGKGKKIVSLAYKEKLLAEIAHYERRIDEALLKRRQTSFEDESSDEDSNTTNPYKLNIRQSGFELKQQEASLSDRASMTLELAMLTIMQSEVNVMVTPPAVRRPVNEDGIWLEVAAECKIDLVSFTITFYAHKPHRRFGPIRYRNVTVDLVKPAHQKELSQSVLPKLNKPKLALQVLQSYATAFRSRRTTLLELAQKYEEKLRMEAMPEGGYRVKFLNLLQVDWTLENLWSPIVPFCHRMKFEVEYMPKDYIHTIGKLYKQFKDPSLETPERTLILGKIFDTCLQAQGPAREIQETLESDPETAGRLHERRTTIDQEPDIPNVASPQKPKGKENKAQNRKTTMEPPKTIPKKAKKDAKKSKDKDIVDNRNDVERGIENNETNGVELNEKDMAGNRKGVVIENDGNDTGKKTNAKVVAESRKGVKSIEDSTNTTKKSTGKEKGIESRDTHNAKNLNTKDVVDNRKGVKRGIDDDSTNTAKKANAKDVTENRKGVKRVIENGGSNDAKKTRTDEGIVNSKGKPGLKGGKDGVEDNGEAETVSSKDKAQKKVSGKNVKETDIGTSENDAMKKGNDKRVKTNTTSDKPNKSNDKDTQDTTSKKSTMNGAAKNKAASKNIKTVSGVAVPKNKTSKGVEDRNVANSEDKGTAIDHTETVNNGYSKTVISKKDVAKVKASTNKEDVQSKKVNKFGTKQANGEKVSKTSEGLEKAKDAPSKHAVPKDTNTAKPKEVIKQVANKKTVDNEITKNHSNKDTRVKETDKVIEKGKGNTEKLTDNSVKATNNNKNKETTQSLEEKKKVLNPKTAGRKSEQNKNSETTADKTTKGKVNNKNNEPLVKKSMNNKPDATLSKNKNDDKQVKLSALDKKENNKNVNPKLSQNANNILKEKTNRNENFQKVVEINKFNDKNNTTFTKTDQKNTNNLNVVTKSKNIPISKISTESQLKLADKLKTKIPMMKSKLKLSALNEKVLPNNMGKISRIPSGVEKTKMPLKRLPVFKKIVKNLPTRISPRKLASTFKPSSRGFSNK